ERCVAEKKNLGVEPPVGRRHYRTSGGGAAETAHEAVKPQSARQTAERLIVAEACRSNQEIREKPKLKNRRRFCWLNLFLLLFSLPAFAQEKLLTIDDIFDPAKRVNFNGTPANPRWLKDGVHYMVVSRDRNASPRLLRVDALTGKSQPLYDAARMEAAFASLPGKIGRASCRERV